MNLLRRYFYWTFERGDFHYDVMVTFIIAFIFISPHLWDYKDKPFNFVRVRPSQVIVRTLDKDSFLIEVPVAALNGATAPDLQSDALLRVIVPITGSVDIQRTEPVTDANGRLVSLRVWATR